MNENRTGISKWAVKGLYFFTFLLVFWPLADLVTNTWPLQPESLQWRYGFMGLMAGFLLTPILGLSLAMVLAYALRHRRTLRVLSAMALAGATVLFAVLIFFALDVVQVRSSVTPDRLPSFQAGSAIAELKHFTSFVALFLIGVGGWRTGTRSKPGAQTGVDAPKNSGTPKIVMKSDE